MYRVMGDGSTRTLECSSPTCHSGLALEQKLLSPVAVVSGSDGKITWHHWFWSNLGKIGSLWYIIFVILTCSHLTNLFWEDKFSVLPSENKVADENQNSNMILQRLQVTWIWFWFRILIVFDFWLWFLIFQVQFTLAISIWSDVLCQMELYVPCLNYLRLEWLTDTTWPWIPMTMFYIFLMPNPIGLFDYWTWSILLTLTLITKLSLEVESGVCQVSN